MQVVIQGPQVGLEPHEERDAIHVAAARRYVQGGLPEVVVGLFRVTPETSVFVKSLYLFYIFFSTK